MNCCAREMETYCVEDNIPFHNVLLVDSAHLPFTDGLHSQNQSGVSFFTIISFIHSRDQGIVAAFKAHSLRRTTPRILPQLRKLPRRH